MLPETLVEKKILHLPSREEPITHMIEITGKKDYYGLIIVSTLNGWLFLINHIEKQIVKKLCLQDIPSAPFSLRSKSKPQRQKEDNILYYMGAYSSFNYETAPFIIVHDRLDGVYMLHFLQRTKTMIKGHEGCERKWEKQPELDWFDENDPVTKLFMKIEDCSDILELKKKPQNHLDIAMDKKDESFWQERFRSCQFCNSLSMPMRDGVVIHRDARQLFVVQANRIQVICYEASNASFQLKGKPSLAERVENLQEIRTALCYDFKFPSLAEDAKFLKEKQDKTTR